MTEELRHSHRGGFYHKGCLLCEDRKAKGELGVQSSEIMKRRSTTELEKRITALENAADTMVITLADLSKTLEELSTALRRSKSEFDIHRLHHNETYVPGRGTGR